MERRQSNDTTRRRGGGQSRSRSYSVERPRRQRRHSRSRSRERRRRSRSVSSDSRSSRSSSSSYHKRSRKSHYGDNDRRRPPPRDNSTNSRDSRRHGKYGPESNSKPPRVVWGKPTDDDDPSAAFTGEKEKPNFGLSGALARDSVTGNSLNGIVLKFSEPIDSRMPTKKWRLYVFKSEECLATLYLHRKSAFLIGREKLVADVLVEHMSCSGQHAVLQFRGKTMSSEDNNKDDEDDDDFTIIPYIMDLNSTHGTRLNGKKIEQSRYVELRHRDLIQFGESTREYILMDATSSSSSVAAAE